MEEHGQHRALVIRAAAFALWAGSGPADACRLALVLAMDVSSSVDAPEDALQRQGLAAALTAPDVMEAVFASPDPVAVAIFEWSGRYNQSLLAPWTLVRSPDDLRRLSDLVARSRRSHDDFPTAMGHALGYASGLLRDGPDCLFRTIDIAGDGINNEGFGPTEAYAAFPFDGVTVNGLVVNAADFEGEIDLIPFFETEVLRGPGAFIEIAASFRDYEAAMRRKLVRELGVQMLGGRPEGSAG